MSHPTKLTMVEQLRHQVDVSTTLCMVSQNDKRPDVVEARKQLERTIATCNAVLVKLKGGQREPT